MNYPVKDLTGLRFGKLLVVARELTPKKKKKAAWWLLHCDCGNTIERHSHALTSGQSRHCGCSYKSTLKDITGLRFGRWSVISRAGNNKNGHNLAASWNCLCDCGVERVRLGLELRNGKSKSCGCSLTGPQPHRLLKYARDQHHAWKGGRSIDKKGYVILTNSVVHDFYPDASWRDGRKQRRMFEHQAVISNYLKRPLYADETIHHKNGDRSDNRLENLELRAGKHGPGQTIPDLIAWAQEILKRYAQN